jgi:hypothetical protein
MRDGRKSGKDQSERRRRIQKRRRGVPVGARNSWTGSAADLLRAGAGRTIDGISRDGTGWPKNPRALAVGCAQTFLRALGIDIAFGREGRAGSRIIRMRTLSNIPSAPSAPSATLDPASGQPPPPSAPDVCEDNYCPDLVDFWPLGQVSIATTDGAGRQSITRLGPDELLKDRGRHFAYGRAMIFLPACMR